MTIESGAMWTNSAQWMAWIAGYVVNSAWQVPVVWGFGLAGARVARRLGPGVVYRVWMGALMAAVFLPALAGQSFSWPLMFAGAGTAGGTVRVSMFRDAAPSSTGFFGALQLAPWAIQVICVLYVATILFGLLRLGYGLLGVRRLCRAAVPLPVGSLSGTKHWQTGVVLAELAAIAGPMVVGMRPAWLLLPVGFAGRVNPEDMEAAIAHELAHVRRHDYAKNLLCQWLALPVSWHPCVWSMRARLAESREMACDALAAEVIGSPRHAARARYARSLLRLAEALPSRLPGALQATPPSGVEMAVGMLDGNRLERRVTQMMQTQKEVNRAGKAAVVAGLLLMTAVAGATVSGMHLNVQGDVQGAGVIATANGPVKWDVAPKLVHSIDPEYPPGEMAKDKAQAKNKGHIVVLRLTIGAKGTVEQARVEQTAGQSFDKNAIEAARQYRFDPAKIDGRPVASQVRVEVNFQVF